MIFSGEHGGCAIQDVTQAPQIDHDAFTKRPPEYTHSSIAAHTMQSRGEPRGSPSSGSESRTACMMNLSILFTATETPWELK